MMKFGSVIPHIKNMKKVSKSCDTPLSSADMSIFSTEISNFCYIWKYRRKLFFLIDLTCIKSLKVILINLIVILMMSAKFITPGLLNVKVF